MFRLIIRTDYEAYSFGQKKTLTNKHFFFIQLQFSGLTDGFLPTKNIEANIFSGYNQHHVRYLTCDSGKPRNKSKI